MLGCRKEWQHRSHMGSTPSGGGPGGGRLRPGYPGEGSQDLGSRTWGPSSMMTPPGVRDREGEREGVLEKSPWNLQGLAPDHPGAELRCRGRVGSTALHFCQSSLTQSPRCHEADTPFYTDGETLMARVTALQGQAQASHHTHWARKALPTLSPFLPWAGAIWPKPTIYI